jgi:ribosomal protein L12E/L44/L45/RPP1/RPP2
MQYKGKEITKEMLEKAQQCESAQELMKLADEIGIELSVEEAEAFIDELADIELDEETLNQVAGGGKPSWCKVKRDSCKSKKGFDYG